MLDGNVAAGKLSQVFALELTTARGRCAQCGAEAQIAEARAFVEAPGLVLRCASCDNVLLVLVQAGDRYVLGLAGMAWLEIRA